MPTKLDYNQYPQLKEQVEYLRDIQNLSILLSDKINILKDHQTEDPLLLNDNSINLIKTKLEKENLDRKIIKKKESATIWKRR